MCPVNLVWFKRDLRLSDHAPLTTAIQQGLPTLLLYCFEPSVIASPDADLRHWRFIHESLRDMQARLPTSCTLLLCHREVTEVLDLLSEHYHIRHIYSHQETGGALTFDRDKAVAAYCRSRGIVWQEFGQDAVVRRLRTREGWEQQWKSAMQEPLCTPDLSHLIPVPELQQQMDQLKGPPLPEAFSHPHPSFQPGGETNGLRYLHSFFTSRAEHYTRHISKPELSRRSCSRFSPYLAWGNLSMRQVYQVAEYYKNGPFARPIRNFQERLMWRSHFMQKMENHYLIETQTINPGFEGLGRVFDERLFEAWANGQTGYPMVDASMRSVQATGFLNFRMRAMLVSFLTFPLWQPWQAGASHLARLFLDFEPGIHYSQFQMQAGTAGYHTLRVYNPVTQAQRHDPEGVFVRKWVPELRALPHALLAEPWKMTAMEQHFYDCRIGHDYPAPVIDFDSAARQAKDRYWALRQSPEVQQHIAMILKHRR